MSKATTFWLLYPMHAVGAKIHSFLPRLDWSILNCALFFHACLHRDFPLKAAPLHPMQEKLQDGGLEASLFGSVQRGKLISENPEEEKKQKNIKSLLNKITPEKYVVIRDKLLAAEIDSPLSLYGLIDQVSFACFRYTKSSCHRNICCISLQDHLLLNTAKPQSCSINWLHSRFK